MKHILPGRVFLLFFLVWFFYTYSEAQDLCDGNLGENIFTSGDFGSGPFNVVPFDPGIAPGYIYTTNVPPPDGSYTITNNTGEWPGLFGTWLEIEDNSPDPEGYMMLVNASYDPGVFFEQTIIGLCENTTYEFSADIINVIRPGVGGHLAPNVSFLLDGTIQFTTGDISQSGNWITYGFTFDTPPGVTEMTLTLQNNAPGGIGNDLALDNISFRACGPSAFINTDETIFLCADANDPAAITADISLDEFFIQWQISRDTGLTWEDIPGEEGQVFFHEEFIPGIYQYRYLSASNLANLGNFKCRIISDVIEIQVLPIFYEVIDSICVGTPYLLGEDTLSQSGTYMADLISSKGCDSIVTLHLTVLEKGFDFEAIVTDPLCRGDANGKIEIVNIDGATPPLIYFFNEEISTEGPVFNNLEEGIQTIRIKDRFMCFVEKEVETFKDAYFDIEVGADVFLKFGEQSDEITVLGTQPIDNVFWTPANYLSCGNCSENRIDGVQTTTYYIEGINEEGCIANDTLTVFVEEGELPIYIPNIFTPDGDGINDYFQLYSFDQSVVQIRSLQIFDRWGGLVYKNTNFLSDRDSNGWDGTFNGKILSQGVYVYVFELELLGGETVSRSGSVTLMR